MLKYQKAVKKNLMNIFPQPQMNVKGIFFLLLIIIQYSCAQNLPELNKIVKQDGLQLKTPSSWSFDKLPLPSNMGYTLALFDDEEENTLTIMVMYLHLPLEEIFSMSQDILQRNQVINSLKLSSGINETFNSWDSKELYFIGKSPENSETVKGKSISFTTGSKSIIITYLGKLHYDQNRLVKQILSMVEIRANDVGKTDNRNGWNSHTIAEIAEIDIPNTLELRNQDAYNSLKATYLKKKFKARGINMETSNIVFQTKGTNKASEGEFEEYGRILIDYNFGSTGDFYSWNEDLSFFAEMEKGLSQSLKEEITSPMPQLNIKLIEWFPLEYRKKNGKGLSYIKTSYLRQMGSNPIIKTERYNFFNDSEAVTITLSYRINESVIWAADFHRVINSFNFITKYN